MAAGNDRIMANGGAGKLLQSLDLSPTEPATHEPRPRHRHGRRLHPAEPASWASCATSCCPPCSAPGRWPMRSSWRSSCPTSSAACSPRAPSRPPSCRCSPASCTSGGRAEALAFARQAQAALLLVLVPFTVLLILAMPGVMAVLAPGMRDDAADLRHGRRVRPHHLSLSVVHLARLALRRRAEQHRSLRPCGRNAGPAEPHHDRRRARPHAASCPTAAMPRRSAWRSPASCNGCGCWSPAPATASA